jgi:hypothetical protein
MKMKPVKEKHIINQKRKAEEGELLYYFTNIKSVKIYIAS